jgi:hypothetical protein
MKNNIDDYFIATIKLVKLIKAHTSVLLQEKIVKKTAFKLDWKWMIKKFESNNSNYSFFVCNTCTHTYFFFALQTCECQYRKCLTIGNNERVLAHVIENKGN